ncbi:hypothetical protein JOM56_005407 [Amanita muscaria]
MTIDNNYDATQNVLQGAASITLTASRLEMPPKAKSKTINPSLKQPCPVCSKVLAPQGRPAHVRACQARHDRAIKDAQYEQELMNKGDQGSPAPQTVENLHPWERPNSIPPVSGHSGEASPYRVDDIKTEFSPKSGRPARVDHYEDYQRSGGARAQKPAQSPKLNPWHPFRSRAEFKLSKLALDCALTREQVDILTETICGISEGKDMFSIRNYSEMVDLWDRTASTLTPFLHHSVTSTYKDEERSFDFWYKNLWEWVLDLLSDPRLIHHFEWDAQKLSKFNGTHFIRFYHEPWTGGHFWNIQERLPSADGKPLGILLYADKTRLSSFGTEMGYPIISRCLNLPHYIRNGEGPGGGRVVGWLPVVPGDPSGKDPRPYIDFKRAIWHASFTELLDSISTISKTGCWVECVDGAKRHLFPFICILSADFEEQTIMAATRGANSLFPCPVCLVPGRELDDLRKRHERRTASGSAQLIRQAEGAGSLKDAEEILKSQGLRLINNAFWTVANSDPHDSLSFDRMHNYPHGLGGKHLWPLVKAAIQDLGKPASRKVSEQMACAPPWRGLNRFRDVLGLHFSDATKFEDILKPTDAERLQMIVFMSHNVLEQGASPNGYLLLRCVRSYTFLDTYASMEVHTEETLSAIESELLVFADLIQQYIVSSYDEDNPKDNKNWDFPKMHLQQHMSEDIRMKGVTRNYSTKPSEKMHRLLKESYQLRTNFKAVATQILKVDHRKLAIQIINERISYFDKYEPKGPKPKNSDDNDNDDDNNNDNNDVEGLDTGDPTDDDVAAVPEPYANIQIGASQKTCTFRQLEIDKKDDRAFDQLRTKLGQHVTTFRSTLCNVRPDDDFNEFRFIKAYYESRVTWEADNDYLRCSPSFHSKERYDCVMINKGEGRVMFACLLFNFMYSMAENTYSDYHPFALVLPYDVIGVRQQKDKYLQLLRLRRQARHQSMIISAFSIIRGAYLVPTNDTIYSNEYYVVDIIDADMLLRLRSLYPRVYTDTS